MAKVELHSVLGHTAKRILQIQKEIINYIEADSVNNVILIVALALLNTSRGFQIQISKIIAFCYMVRAAQTYYKVKNSSDYLEKTPTIIHPLLQTNKISIQEGKYLTVD